MQPSPGFLHAPRRGLDPDPGVTMPPVQLPLCRGSEGDVGARKELRVIQSNASSYKWETEAH